MPHAQFPPEPGRCGPITPFPIPNIMLILLKIFELILAIALLVVAAILRSPSLANYREGLFWLSLVGGAILIFAELAVLPRPSPRRIKLMSFLVLALSFASLSANLVLAMKFNLIKQSVLNADPSRLAKLGQHFVVGYRDPEEVAALVEKRAIGGVFLTARNIENKSKTEIRQEISGWQETRRRQGLSPLWIAADQEGGIVSRLSPPLTYLPPLSEIIAEDRDIEASKNAVIEYAMLQGRELYEIGVNLNFAPVVDLNKGALNPDDKYSLIYRRAISADKDVVAKVASWYCQTLEKQGVRCTLKHFPGLGRVAADTHVEDAQLDTSLEELREDDWVPFQAAMQNTRALTMLSHAKLMAVDGDRPVSFSNKAIVNILRQDWQYNGILITDDFCMRAAYNTKLGLAGATVAAMNAGVDLILIAFDSDLYYPAMHSLLQAEADSKLDMKMLEKSRRRLQEDRRVDRQGEG